MELEVLPGKSLPLCSREFAPCLAVLRQGPLRARSFISGSPALQGSGKLAARVLPALSVVRVSMSHLLCVRQSCSNSVALRTRS